VGYEGGYWNNGVFAYNRTVNNFGSVSITNVYSKTVIVNNNVTRASFNGGAGGTTARPTPQEQAATREPHVAATPLQTQHAQAASTNKAMLASVNHGSPAIAATARPGQFEGKGVVPAKGGNPAVPATQARPNAGPVGAAPAGAAALEKKQPLENTHPAITTAAPSKLERTPPKTVLPKITAPKPPPVTRAAAVKPPATPHPAAARPPAPHPVAARAAPKKACAAQEAAAALPAVPHRREPAVATLLTGPGWPSLDRGPEPAVSKVRRAAAASNPEAAFFGVSLRRWTAFSAALAQPLNLATPAKRRNSKRKVCRHRHYDQPKDNSQHQFYFNAAGTMHLLIIDHSARSDEAEERKNDDSHPDDDKR
jgi:hypothetical protein